MTEDEKDEQDMKDNPPFFFIAKYDKYNSNLENFTSSFIKNIDCDKTIQRVDDIYNELDNQESKGVILCPLIVSEKYKNVTLGGSCERITSRKRG